VTGAALACRRVVWEQVGPLDARFALYGQDLDFCLRAGERGWRVAVVGASRVVHHQGATVSQASGATARQNAPLLWADLVRWAAKRRGAGGARNAARLLRLGGAVQRMLLAAEGLRGGEHRLRAAAERRALRSAAAAAAEASTTDAANLPPPGERSTTR
jgi:GT2 family glycosyltransferase